jgi:SAM-dependent methyltransferase
MAAYNHFALVYDLMMAEVPYEAWVDNVIDFMKKHEVKNKLVVDLGCGTGTGSLLLSKKGYEVIGVDMATDMLMIAKEKAKEAGEDILFLNQDMRELELFGSAACILSLCDSMNYLIEEEDLLEVFKRANYYLDEDGLFIFDMNTAYYFSQIMGDNTFARTFPNCAYILDNYYDEDEAINEYNLTLFIEEGKGYTRHEEVHYEKAYSMDTVTWLLKEASLELEGIYDVESMGAPTRESSRILFVAKKGK